MITALLTSRANHTRLTTREKQAIAMCVGGVGLFVIVAALTTTTPPLEDAQLLVIVIILAVVLIACTIL
ncbi:MAG: multidrug transporter permease, partial [Microbacteriaceae bacterium]|nr:multidrug transporter permease [Microbacteriaceae bacterium]